MCVNAISNSLIDNSNTTKIETLKWEGLCCPCCKSNR